MPINRKIDQNTVTLNVEGGMFQDPVSAFAYAGTLGATSANRINILAGPGNFNVDSSSGVGMSLPANCCLIGSGDYSTTFTATGAGTGNVLLEIDNSVSAAENAVENIKLLPGGNGIGIQKAGSNVLNLRRIVISFAATAFQQLGGNVFCQGMAGVFNVDYIDLQGGLNFVMVDSNPVLTSGNYFINGDATGSVGCNTAVLGYNTFFAGGTQAAQISFGTNTIMSDIYQGLSDGINLRGTNASCVVDIYNMSQASDMTTDTLVIDSGFVGTYNILNGMLDASAFTLNGAPYPSDFVDNQTGNRYSKRNTTEYTTTQTQTQMDQNVVLNHATTAFTYTLLPVADVVGREISLHNKGAASVTIDGDGSETINGDTTVVLTESESITIFNDGTEWYLK